LQWFSHGSTDDYFFWLGFHSVFVRNDNGQDLGIHGIEIDHLLGMLRRLQWFSHGSTDDLFFWLVFHSVFVGNDMGRIRNALN
jgi:hypothetical protein